MEIWSRLLLVFIYLICVMFSGTSINSQDAFMLSTRKVGLMCSVRYCASPYYNALLLSILILICHLYVIDLVYVDVLVNL